MNATSESVGQIYESLIAETGEIVKMSMKAKINAPRDYEGFEALRAMAG